MTCTRVSGMVLFMANPEGATEGRDIPRWLIWYREYNLVAYKKHVLTAGVVDTTLVPIVITRGR
jgi:hypothetical protein